MKTGPDSHSTQEGGSVVIGNENDKHTLADSPADIHGESRAQVLESGGRVDKWVTTKRGVSVGTGDSGHSKIVHHARSTPETDSGGLELSVGIPGILDAVATHPHSPSQGKMNLPLRRRRWRNTPRRAQRQG